jgi:hypothetical protein
MNSKKIQLFPNILPSFSPNINANPNPYPSVKINVINSVLLRQYNSLCSICLNKYKKPCFIKPCFHLFCLKCLRKWKKYNYACPLCRTIIISIIKLK